MELIVRPHIMSDRDKTVKDVPLGSTIADVIETLHEIDERVRHLHLAVLVDGLMLPREEWTTYRISGTERRIEIAAMLHGGGQSKQILGLIAVIALSIASGGLAAGLVAPGGLMAGTGLTAGIVQGGIMMVGSLVINKIFAPPAISSTTASDTGAQSNAYTFGSQSNAIRAFGPVMRVYGTNRVRPDLAAVPYTLNVGDDTYFYAIYSFGYGPLKLEDFKIGTNPLTNYKDYQIVVHELFTSPDQLQLYKNDIWQDSYNAEITQATPVLATTRPAIDEAIVDVLFVQGLGHVNDAGGTDPIATTMLVEYHEQGQTAWQPANLTIASVGSAGQNVQGYLKAVPVVVDLYTEAGGGSYTTFKLPAGSTTAAMAGWGIDPGTGIASVPPAGTPVKLGPYDMVIAAADAFSITFTQPTPGDLSADGAGNVGFTYSGGKTSGGTPSTASGRWDITIGKAGSFIASTTINFPYAATWVVRVTKIEPDPAASDSRTLWKRSLVALKSLKAVPPLNPEVPLTIVEFKIKATGQLNGSVEEFSALATSKLRTWSNGWVQAETRNPAWVYLDILTGSANRRAIADSRIDMDRIIAWAAKCDEVNAGFIQPMGTCDVIIDKSYTVWELLQSVGSTARAAPTMRDNKYSVLVDDSSREPVQMFTPRNSSNLRSSRTYVDEPHALRVKWIDPESNWQQAEVLVYNTGRDENNSTVFEEITTFGITRLEAAIRYGRYMMAQGKLRQERFSLETDIENIVCLRGDMVLVAHDVIEVGGEASRIEFINGQTLVLDSPPSLVDGLSPSTLGVRIRTDDGQLSGVLNISSYDNDAYTITLSYPPPANVKAGDLLVIGEITAVTGSYIVDSVVPNNDLGATINLEEYAPGVYDAELTGVFPEYVPQGGGSYAAPPPTNLTAQVIEFIDDATFPRCSVLVSWSPPENSQQNYPVGYKGWAVGPDGTETYLGQTAALSYVDGPIDLWRVGGHPRYYRIRAVYGNSSLSLPAEVFVVLPQRDPEPPIAVESFQVENLADGMRRYLFGWAAWPIEGVVGVEVRYLPGSVADPVWDNMLPVLSPYFTQSGLELSTPQGEGLFTFGAKAVDVRGMRSINMNRVVVTLSLSSAEQAAQSGIGDKTPPPTPLGLQLSPGIGSLFVQVTNIDYTEGGGHDHMNLYGLVYNGGTLPTFVQAHLLGSVFGDTGMIALEPGTTYAVWAKHVAKSGVMSVTPAGGTNGIMVQTGQDPAKLLNLLTGKITEGQLFSSLNSRINLVDGPDTLPGSVAARDKAIYDYAQWRVDVESNVRQVDVGHLQGTYVVKIDANGYVAGYGIAIDANNGVVTSGFVIRADSFAIAAPGVPWVSSAQGQGNLTPQIPFVVQAAPTFIAGVAVPAGVYMRDAFIMNGTISNAMIGNLVVTNAKIGTLAVDNHNIVGGAVTGVARIECPEDTAGVSVGIPAGCNFFQVICSSGSANFNTGTGAEAGAGAGIGPGGVSFYFNGTLMASNYGTLAFSYGSPPEGTFWFEIRRAREFGWQNWIQPGQLTVMLMKK